MIDLIRQTQWMVDKVDTTSLGLYSADIRIIKSMRRFVIQALDDVMLTRAEVDFELVREDLLLLVFKFRDSISGHPNTNEQLLKYVVEMASDLINRGVDTLKILFEIRNEVDMIMHKLASEFFLLLERGAEDLHNRVYKIREHLVHTLNTLDFAIEAYMLRLGEVLVKIKASLRQYVNKYKEILNTYSGGSGKILKQFLTHVKGEIFDFSQELLRII